MLNYGITLGGVTSALRPVVYVKPPQLLASLRTGLTMYFPFEGDLADKAVGGGSIVPFDGVQAPVFKSPGVFGKTFQNERSGDPVGAFKWQYPAGLLTSTQVFTIGFWYQSDGTANDARSWATRTTTPAATPASPSPSGPVRSCASTWPAAAHA